jgi:hypothetical protein
MLTIIRKTIRTYLEIVYCYYFARCEECRDRLMECINDKNEPREKEDYLLKKFEKISEKRERAYDRYARFRDC